MKRAKRSEHVNHVNGYEKSDDTEGVFQDSFFYSEEDEIYTYTASVSKLQDANPLTGLTRSMISLSVSEARALQAKSQGAQWTSIMNLIESTRNTRIVFEQLALRQVLLAVNPYKDVEGSQPQLPQLAQ